MSAAANVVSLVGEWGFGRRRVGAHVVTVKTRHVSGRSLVSAVIAAMELR